MDSIPEYFEGPLISDLIEAGGAASFAGGLLGFVAGGFAHWLWGVKPTDVAGYGAGLLGVFTVALVLFSRMP